MGAGQSGSVDIGGSSMGYQVLRVYPDSPGSRAGLKAYFDFIVAIGNTRFNKENGSLREILKASVDQKLKMVVYNTRTKSCREVEIVPSTSWGGNGLLGVSIKHSSFDRADERVWHVVDVEPGSPAAQAGFKPNEDYVIGSDSILQENDDLYNLVEAHEGKALKLFVYNTSSDNCREIVCHPNSKWGGKGYLGCEFGHGLLHRIPYGDGGETSDDPRASLVRNEHPMGSRAEQAPPAHNPNSFQSLLMQNQVSQLHAGQPQPGQQLFQQALSQPQLPTIQQSTISQQQAPMDSRNPKLEYSSPAPQQPVTMAQQAQHNLATVQSQSQPQQPPYQSPQVSSPAYMGPQQSDNSQRPQQYQQNQPQPSAYNSSSSAPIMQQHLAQQQYLPPIETVYQQTNQHPQHCPPQQQSPQTQQIQPPSYTTFQQYDTHQQTQQPSPPQSRQQHQLPPPPPQPQQQPPPLPPPQQLSLQQHQLQPPPPPSQLQQIPQQPPPPPPPQQQPPFYFGPVSG